MKQITLCAKEYNDMMRALKTVISKDQSRPCLAGVFLEVEENTARFTALNGCVMTHFVLPHTGDMIEGPWSVVMPIMPIKAQPKALITITVDGNQITVKNVFTGEAVTQRAIEGEYVHYRNVIPDPKREHHVYVDARLLKSALDSAELCDQALVRLSFDLASQYSPLLLKGCNNELFYTGIVMPVRPNDEYLKHVI